MSRGNYWIALDKNMGQYLKYIKRPYSEIEAMYSYSLDVDNGKEGSIAGYSVLWEWSRNKVRRFIKGIRTVKGHIKDSKRTVKGQAIHFIDNALMTKKDSKRTVKGHIKDSKRYTTIKPSKPNKPNKKKKSKPKKDSLSDYLKDMIINNNFIEIKNKIFEFYKYRQSMPKAKRYKTEAGINMLFKDLNGCRDRGLIVSECIDEAIGRDWLTPKPDYFKNTKPINGNTETAGDRWLRKRRAARGETQ
ncbi:MAG: hypothetical protein GY941_23520 [Planctomycetes bacterium]|nr:hypothetical protein [Planctomycetota bacterium]